MKSNTNISKQVTKECQFCKEQFVPHPKVGDRQGVCSRYECQQLRQKLNRLDWVERNPVDYRKWYQDYGKAWRASHPDYQQEYRKAHKAQMAAIKKQEETDRGALQLLLWRYKREKKEELTSVKTDNDEKRSHGKKEELTHCLYLVKARELEFLPLIVEKKEELSYCIHTP